RGAHRRVAGLCVEDPGLRIETGAGPIHAAARVADVDRAEILATAGWLKRRRNEWRLLPAVLAQIVECLLAQLRREVDDVVLTDEGSGVRRWLARNRLRRRRP